ncbi:protein kinase domain-containing protein [Humidesulfovibrio idahonensis]
MRAIGRYAILGLLGRGGMGAVYKAAMPRAGRVVALKLLAPSEMLAAVADAEALRKGFFREAALMAGIRHPGVAQVLDVDEDATGRPFFVMEYYCNNLGAELGESYRVEEPTRRLGVERSLALAQQLAGALARLHHEGIIHRDVKPFNMMLADNPPAWPGAAPDVEALCPGDEVKLIDFGLSRLRGEVEAGRPRGAVVGSPYYAAPEQEADPDSADERADVFSAGVTLFRCLTGRLPQEGRPASALRPGLDARFDAFFVRCCHEDPARRPSSARALSAELAELADHWRGLRAAICALPPEPGASPIVDAGLAAPCGMALRGQPVRQPLRGARDRFDLGVLWEPEFSIPGRFCALDAETVRDKVTGRVWERGGSPYAVTLAGARAYAERLAAERFAGRGGWRLPTVDELCTLLLSQADPLRMCQAPVFSPAQRRLWSADEKSFTAAWYVDAEHGFVWWQDTTCEFFARCVTSEG